MEIVIDANIIIAVVLNEPDNMQVIEATKGVEFVSPDVLPYEKKSPFDAIKGLKTDISNNEIVDIIKETRARY